MTQHALIAIALLIGACDEAEQATEQAPAQETTAEPELEALAAQDASEPTADRGAQVFATSCASCHGDGGAGGAPAGAALDPPAPSLVGPRAEHLRGIPRRQIIESGRPGTAMVGWAEILSPEDLDAVYGFVHALKHGPGAQHGRQHGHGAMNQ